MLNEADRYKISQVQPWLERINLAAKAAKNAQLLVESLERLDKGIDYQKERVHGGEYADRMTDIVDGLSKAKDKAQTSAAEYRHEVDAALERLKDIDAESLSILVACYFVGAETISDAFKAININRSMLGLAPYVSSTRYRKHQEALLMAYEYIPTEWRDPRPSAV